MSERLGYVLIDCPPSLSILTLNALAAADAALVPVQCEFFALEGITQLKETIDFVRSSLNPSLEIHGVVLTMHDSRTKLADEVATEVRSFFGQKVYDTVIPRNVRVAEAPSHGKPLLLYDHKSSGSRAYMDLAAEMINRERAAAAACYFNVSVAAECAERVEFEDVFHARIVASGPAHQPAVLTFLPLSPAA